MKMLSHHIKLDVCTERPKYRQGRKLTAVKVYSVSDESRYLLVQGVPTIGITKELHSTCALHGEVTALSVVDDYPSQQFTKTYLLKYENINNARVAKRKLDDLEFYGSILHVCYAPEYETVDETRWKLQERRLTIARKCRQLGEEKAAAATAQRERRDKLESEANEPNDITSVPQQPTSSLSTQHPTSSLGSDACTLPINPYGQSIPGTTRHPYPYPSTVDDTVNYSYSLESHGGWPDIQPVDIEGLTEVSSRNIGEVTLCDSKRVQVSSANSQNKRKASAIEAASWHAANFQRSKASRIENAHHSPTPVVPKAQMRTVSGVQTKRSTSPRLHAQPDINVAANNMIIRPAKFVESSSQPRFVPRQLSSAMAAAAASGHKEVLANAAKLGEEQRACMPREVEEEVRARSQQHVADSTTLRIRGQIKQVLG